MLSVRWGRHESELLSHLSRYFSGEAFVDVTLWCSGRRFRAHRVVLSACSSYLERLLLQQAGGGPVSLVLVGVAAGDVRRLLELMYRGRTAVPAGRLPRLLAAAAALGLRRLHSAALRVAVAAAADGQRHLLCTDTSYPPIKGDETAKLVTTDSTSLCAAVSPSGQPYESRDDGPNADKAEGPAAALSSASAAPPPQPSPPSAWPAPTQPPPVNDANLLPPGAPTAPPQQPPTVDWSQCSLQTHPLGGWFPEVQGRPEPALTELEAGVQALGHPDAGCASDYSPPAYVTKAGEPVPMTCGPPDSSQHHVGTSTAPHCNVSHYPPASQTEKADGPWLKTDDQYDTMHHPAQPRVAWEMQPCSIPFQQEMKLKDGSKPLEDATRGRGSPPPADAGPHPHPHPQQQQYALFGPLDSCPGYETQAPPHGQPPPWSPKAGMAARKLDALWPMEQAPAQAGSPTRIFTELLPPKASSQPAAVTSTAESSTADQLHGSWRPELKDEYNVKPAYAGSDQLQFQTQQSLLSNDQQQQLCQEIPLEEIPKTNSKGGMENICETCNKTFATRYSLT